MRIEKVERGLRLLTFDCDLCDKEIDVEEIWSVEFEGGIYRTHVCQECLRKMLLEKEVEFTIS